MSRLAYYGSDTSKHSEAEGTLASGYLSMLKDPATFGYPVDSYFKAELRFEGWIDPADRTQGLELLGTLDVTDYIIRNGLKTIIEEIEDFRQAEYGVVKGSRMVQEFIEETDPSTGNLGKMMAMVFAQNHSNSTWWYTYPYGVTGATTPIGGDPDNYRIHLFRLCIWIGDRENDIWLSQGLVDIRTHGVVTVAQHLAPTFDWIYGWLFDPANQTRPMFSTSAPDPQDFSLTGESLFEWLDNFEMGELFGDFSNKSGVYYDDLELEVGDLEYYDVCNYPAVPFVKDGFAEAGVNEDNIDISTVVLTGDDADYSSLYYFRETGIGLAMQPAEGLPIIEWKNVGYVDYRVMVSDKAYPYLRVVTTDRLTADTTYYRLTLTQIPSGYIMVRLWHWLGDIAYILCKHPDEDNFTNYVLIKITLSGTSSADFAVSETAYTLPTSANLKIHYMQMDIDEAEGRVFCTRHYTGETDDNSYVQLGYITLGSPCTWTTLQVFSKAVTGYAARIWHDDNLSTANSAAGGLRVLYSSSRNYAVMFLGWLYDYGNNNEWTLELYRYDDSKTTPYGGDGYDFDSYTRGGRTAYVKNFPEANHAVTGGRGTIGGFYNSIDDLFVFVLPSIDLQCDSGHKDHNGVTKRWTPGSAWSITTEVLSSSSFTSFRTFNSHGTAQNAGGEDYCVGFIGTNRDTSGNDYEVYLKPCMVRWNSTTNALVLTVAANYFHMGDGTASFPTRKYPVLSPPSNDVSSAGTINNVEDRSFLIQKTWGTPSQTQDLFLTTLSLEWYPQFACDFTDGGESLAEFLEEFAFAFALMVSVSHFKVFIRRRYTSAIEADTESISTDLYKLNQVETLPVYHYDNLILTDVKGTEYRATSSISKNVLDFNERGSIFIQPHRASKLLASLWAKHGTDHRRFSIQALWLPWKECLDWVEVSLPIRPGGNGYEDVVCEVFSLEHGLFETELVLIEVAGLSGQIT